jgi:lysozyme
MANNTTPPRVAIGAGAGIAAAIALIVPSIMQHEGHTNHSYRDIGGVLTVCYGHTGPDVQVKTVYTNNQCTAILDKDVTKFANGVVEISPELKDKTQILAATISFSYNVGLGTYQRSSVAKDFHDGKFVDGCKDMLKYTYAGGKYSQGLANRRQAEYQICMKGTT